MIISKIEDASFVQNIWRTSSVYELELSLIVGYPQWF
jgi:hypothetical protein